MREEAVVVEYKSREIVKFYRDKNILLAVEDAMTNKLEKSLYKIAFKLVPQDQNNKAKKNDTLTHYLDVSEVKRLIFHFMHRGTIVGLFNNEETTKNGKIPCYKDLKGGLVNGTIQSRIFTMLTQRGSKGEEYIIQLSVHDGKKYGQGAIIPTSGPRKRLYIKLSAAEMEEMILELNDYIRYKELSQFRHYHNVEVNLTELRKQA